MDSRMDSSDHVTSFHSKEGNLYPQAFSFFKIILHIFRLLLVIFGIPIRDEEDKVSTSEFMLHKEEDLTGRISDTMELEDTAEEYKIDFKNGVEENKVNDVIQKKIISTEHEDSPEEIEIDFKNGVEELKVKYLIQKNFTSLEEDPEEEYKIDFENGVEEVKVNDLNQKKIIPTEDEDSPEEIEIDFLNGVEELKVKYLLQKNFTSLEEEDPAEEYKIDFKNGVEEVKVDDLIQKNFTSPEEEDPPKAFTQEFEKGVQTSHIKDLIQSNFISPADKELPNDNSVDSKNAFQRQDIEELIECILSAGSPNDSTVELEKDVETSKGKDLSFSNSISSVEGKTYNSACDANSGFASSTSETVSKEIKEETLSTSAVKGKQDVRDEYSKGQYHSNPDSAQLEEEVNMAATSYKVGSLNDLDKNSRVVRRTKGSLPNIPAEKSESSWADSVDKEECNIAGVGPLMCHLFEKQLFTDVTFYFQETKLCFSAHRVVLAARCDYFEKLLFGKLMNDAVGMEMHIDINDVPMTIFTCIVKYLYTDAVKLVDDCDVLETYRAAKMYRIHPLMKACKTYIDTIELTENNACSMLELGKSKDIYELKTRCIGYIQNNTSRVIRSKDFEKCCYRTVREICIQDVLNLKSEGELLEAVLCWVDLQKTSQQSKADFRRGLLKQVRFLTFTPREFSEVLQKHPHLLTAQEGLKILMALNNPCADSINNLPKWCNKQAIRRTVQTDQKSIPKSVVEVSNKRWICITLKPLEKRHQSDPLTCLLHLKCLDGARHITRVTFSLDNVDVKGCTFDISVAVTPDGTSFHMTHAARSKESVLTFEKPVTVQADQTFEMEVRAESHQCCRFLQFDRWYSDHLDFMGFFISKPTTNRLYFISMIEYEPV